MKTEQQIKAAIRAAEAAINMGQAGLATASFAAALHWVVGTSPPFPNGQKLMDFMESELGSLANPELN